MDWDEHLKNIARSAGIIAVGMLIGGFLNYLSKVAIARWLGSSIYGLLSMAIAFSSILTIISLFGLPQGLSRYIPHFNAKNNLNKLKGTIFTSLKISLPISLTFSALTFYFSFDIASLIFNKPSLAPVLQIFAFIIPANALLSLLSSCLRGFKQSRYKVYVLDIFRPAARLSLILGFIILGLNILGVSLAYIISSALATMLAFYYLEKKVFSLLKNKVGAKSVTSKLVKYSWPMMLIGILFVFLDNVDLLLLGAFKTSTEVGIYNVALPTSSLLIWVFGAFNFLFRPTVSELFAEERLKDIELLFKKVSRWIFVLGSPLLIIMVMFPSKILEILFGSEYASGGLALSILAVGYFIYSFAGTSYSVLISIGKTKKVLTVYIIILTANIALNLFLIPIYGMVGAAIALSLSSILGSILFILMVHKEMGLQPFTKTLAKSSFPALFLIPIMWFSKHLIPSNLFIFAIFALTSIFFYFILIKLFNIMTEDDLEIIRSLGGSITKKENLI